MKYPLLIILSITSLAPVAAQQVQGTAQTNSHIYGDGFGARVREIPYVPGETVGTYYLFDHWSPGTITMVNGEKVSDIFLKYNFENKSLEIKTDTAYFSMDVSASDQFSIYDDEQRQFRSFIAARRYKLDDTPLTGALELLHQGNVELVAKVAPKLIEANYKGALSGGSTNDKIVKKKEYFLVTTDYELIALPTKKKQAIEVLQQFDPEIESYLKQERLKLKQEEDLIVLAEYLSSQQ
ncbi:MAG: hypothetical protein ACFB15_17200 [Cyclobacteriaceae bacterium]